MKHDRPVLLADSRDRETSRYCCLTHVNSLLKAVRMKQAGRSGLRESRSGQSLCDGDVATALPTPRDLYAAELEAHLVSTNEKAGPAIQTGIAHDDPAEIARADLVLALSLVVPLLLVTAFSSLWATQLDRATASLLQFSATALTASLALVLAANALRGGTMEAQRQPWLALLALAATCAMLVDAFAMPMSKAGPAPASVLSMVGLSVAFVLFQRWLRARTLRPYVIQDHGNTEQVAQPSWRSEGPPVVLRGEVKAGGLGRSGFNPT